MDGPLIAIRAIQFAATVMVGGIILFRCLMLDAVMAPGGTLPLAADRALRTITPLFWLSFALAIASWGAWLLAVAAEIGRLSLGDALFDETTWTVLTQTRFGHAWTARLLVGALIAAGVVTFQRGTRVPRWWAPASVVLAALFLGSLASSGHAGAEQGFDGQVHWAADFLHLVAAGAWLGSLAPLGLVLTAARTASDTDSLALATRVVHRFSLVGIASVAILAITGSLNTLYLVGSVPALTSSPYGRLLVAKVALFAAMLGFAAVNRFGLTPALPDPPAMRDLTRNALIEAGLGMLVLAIVGVLGTLPPGSHMHHPQ